MVVLPAANVSEFVRRAERLLTDRKDRSLVTTAFTKNLPVDCGSEDIPEGLEIRFYGSSFTIKMSGAVKFSRSQTAVPSTPPRPASKGPTVPGTDEKKKY
jgi:hypothetical protein